MTAAGDPTLQFLWTCPWLRLVVRGSRKRNLTLLGPCCGPSTVSNGDGQSGECRLRHAVGSPVSCVVRQIHFSPDGSTRASARRKRMQKGLPTRNKTVARLGEEAREDINNKSKQRRVSSASKCRLIRQIKTATDYFPATVALGQARGELHRKKSSAHCVHGQAAGAAVKYLPCQRADSYKPRMPKYSARGRVWGSG